MKGESQGILVNMAGNGRYKNPEAPEKLLRYITRTNGQPKRDLVAWGGLGVAEFAGVEAVIKQFYRVQGERQRKGEFGRYMDHEVFSLSARAEEDILNANVELDRMARNMARDIYERDHCQVVYGVHRPDKGDGHMHIHFAINTVDWQTGRKRRENRRQTKEREARFQKIVEEEIRGHAKKQ